MTARVRLTPLGGVGAFGRNCLLLEALRIDGGEAVVHAALVIDCGVRFLGDSEPGFDVGLPDLERVAILGPRLLGYAITHGHEDHIGALGYALRENEAPVWATPFTAHLIARRCERLGVALPVVDVVRPGDARTIGPFTLTWLAVSHSIPDATALVIDTPVGRLVHSGDFRIDEDPVLGPPTDMVGLTAAGDAGVRCLLADSTGALQPGRNAGERSVGPALDDAIAGAEGRVVVAAFASHAQRLALIVESCRRHGRKLCVLGRALVEHVGAFRDLGLFDGDDVLVDERGLRGVPRARQCLVVTGTQGEPNAALARLARGDLVTLEAGDRVVLSARVIPGNERRVALLTDALTELGVDVVDARATHVSGHGQREDLELLLLATRPRTFVALHGGARHLHAHVDLARGVGLDNDHIVELRDGSSLELRDDGSDVHVPAPFAQEPFARDGEVAWFPKSLVQSRRRMSDAGMLVLVERADPGATGALRVRFIEHGITTPLDAALLRALDALGPTAFAAAGTSEEPGAMRALSRCFRKAGRVAPEIVLVPLEPARSGARAVVDDEALAPRRTMSDS